ncbi:MAG: hypothetical protein GXO78_08425 [Calditrichaeota bacterium]|nr:hypothetical protein [Calditrichota bacterium]
MKHMGWWMIPLLIFLFFWGCAEQMGPEEESPPFSIEPFKVPDLITVRPGYVYFLAFRVQHPDGWEAIDSVWVTFSESPQAPPLGTLPLFDDGATRHPDDGDVVARDGIFSNRFYPARMGLPARTLILQAFARDQNGNVQSVDNLEITGTDNYPPVILHISVPDTFYAGTPGMIFQATVADSDSVNDVVAVIMQGLQNSVVVFQDTLRRDPQQPNRFLLIRDSSFAAEKQKEYLLEFYALDHQIPSLNRLQAGIYIENEPPVIRSIELPDSVKLPAVDRELITVRARVVDSQSLADIQRVYFTVKRIGSNETNEVELYDDGNMVDNGDLLAGDGIFSRIIVLLSTNTPGDYVFTFYAIDRVQQMATTVVDTLKVLPN